VKKQVVVIGGGASGFFCAIAAAEAGQEVQVTLLEKHAQVLQKVKVSGGGRCNVTHACFQLSDLLKRYPRGKNFLKKAFRHFACADTMQWFSERGVALKTETDGRVFPVSDQSQSIIDCLLNEAGRLGVNLQLKADVKALERDGQGWTLTLQDGRVLHADAVFVGTGGSAKASGYDWLRQLGHSIAEPLPSLFTFNIPDKKLHALMGLSVPQAHVRINGSKLEEEGPLLITHWGLSGPAVLRLSAWGAEELAARHYDFEITVNWIGEKEHQLRERWAGIRQAQAGLSLQQKNPFALPARLWDYLLESAAVPGNLAWSELPAKEQNRLIHTLCAQTFGVKGKTTFKEEFVTCGGINTTEVNPDTMESRICPGLYFGGEVLNVDGITGGFNFQHAWTSGYLAGRAMGG
jgi:predicted Rossmann fold flavoprotein